jgi:hypothetical protein
MKKFIFSLLFISPLFLSPLSLEAATYQVGPGRTYTNLQAVAGLLSPSDVVEVDGGNTYPGDVVFTEPGTISNKITIRGIRSSQTGRPVISGGTNTVHFMTSWPYDGSGEANGSHYIFEGFEVTGGSSRGIYHQADDLTIRDVVVHDCPAHGILGADQGSGSLILKYTEVYNCGQGDSRHQIYMATDEVNHPGSIFRMKHCYIHDGIGGNNVKSRAERNMIYYNWIEGAYYHELELIGPDPGGAPDGWTAGMVREDSDVVGNVIWSRKEKDHHVIRIGGDGTGETDGRYRFVNNTIILSAANNSSVFRLFDGLESIEMHNNAIYRLGGGVVNTMRKVDADWAAGTEIIDGFNNWIPSSAINIPVQWGNTIFGDSPGFTDLAGTEDLRPAEGSPLINAGDNSPIGPSGYPFPDPLFPPIKHPPPGKLEHKGTAEIRPSNGTIDIGAYEYGPPLPTPHPPLSTSDFNGDGTSEITVFRPSSGLWAIRDMTRIYFGSSSDQIIPGDYNGDGTTEVGIFRPSTGLWALKGVSRIYFGSSADMAIPGDYDGDGYCDIGIFRETSGLWAIRGVTRVYFGLSSDQPRTGDYSGNGTSNIAIFRKTSGLWAIRGITRLYFGSASDQPVPGDFYGSGTSDISIFRESTGLWAIRGITRLYFGSSTDQPVPADYNGDLSHDIGIFRETSGLWAIKGITRTYFGSSGDIPVTR